MAHGVECYGSIPAGAGNPRPSGRSRRSRPVHPRGCGESAELGALAADGSGPSPRVRGIRVSPHRDGVALGSIPAGAGNPAGRRGGGGQVGVHPRGCGESLYGLEPVSDDDGPSPRVRGILFGSLDLEAVEGSIPAGAGNPGLPIAEARNHRVHPRGCGESLDSRGAKQTPRGPSPRVRGIPEQPRLHRPLLRSIPAGAGNPGLLERIEDAVRVHPRGCGESAVNGSDSIGRRGPSPRVRGIPGADRAAHRAAGSIPAGAGNPR